LVITRTTGTAPSGDACDHGDDQLAGVQVPGDLAQQHVEGLRLDGDDRHVGPLGDGGGVGGDLHAIALGQLCGPVGAADGRPQLCGVGGPAAQQARQQGLAQPSGTEDADVAVHARAPR
jgi:hypothetical protein